MIRRHGSCPTIVITVALHVLSWLTWLNITVLRIYTDSRRFLSLSHLPRMVRLLPSFLLLAASVHNAVAQTQYLLGLGIADITGPVTETNMMGYASLGQTDSGLHQRQRARAFIVGETGNTANRIVFINADIAMGDTGIRRAILAKLAAKYGSLYTAQNFALSSTHQHSGVGGYLENLLPQLTALGFVQATYDAIVQGVVLAVDRAHASLKTGTLSIGNGTVVGGNRNRSPTAYLANPASERALYTNQGDDQDTTMSLLNFGADRGFLSFFAVHGTSIYENNTLISTDNKGMAAYLYEASVEPNAMPGANTFVAGFAQANVGDTSPNTLGAFCESPGQPFDGQPCQANTSTCGGTVQQCHGRGPGFRLDPYGFHSNTMIAQTQVDAAKSIMGGKLSPVSGTVRSVHIYLKMANHTFTLPNGTTAMTCPAAMGYSFAGGTTDGPGAFDFVQGDNSTSQNPLWEIVKGAVTPSPSAAQIACHAPKPILLNTGYATFPYSWSPDTVDIQMLKVGNFVMALIPGELTTMAGRRLRNAIRAALISQGVIDNSAYVVVSGPANTYGHYITTREEYAIQRYEGASTLFGPYTLEAYIDKYTSLVPFLADSPSGTPASDAAPPALQSSAISLQTGVVFDAAPIGKSFGNVLVDAAKTYTAGQTVSVQFVGATPRNNLRLEGTFLSVQQLASGAWKAVRSDSHPSTTYQWVRVNTILGTSTVTLNWTIEAGTPAGTYRIQYFGDSKPLIGSISAFTGTSGNFTVSA
ncbi:Neutral ceramidase [Mycena indigotica]|uniref:Neutral ceramidase n=1 Tax=Mycena indigotica TaxID=2126181 RepID=A0A8H6TFU0_9AGAR|nr:Neutral ceramidase [Mycena indigotica]KAF7316474.1 Neutral ceramidase [Mycena indigotica]